MRNQLCKVLWYSIGLLLCSDSYSMASDYEYVWSISNQVMISRALYVAADLDLADQVSTPLPLKQLADRVGVDCFGLQRLLRCLMEYGIFAYDQNGLVCNTVSSMLLQKDHPQTIRPFILHDDPTRWNAIGNLGYSIKTGKASFDEIYHTDYFSYLKYNDLLSERFDEAMTIISQQEDKCIAQMINFNGIVADIGGGKGQLLQRIGQYNKSVTQLILFDLAQVQDNVEVSGTVMTQVAGSFFEPITVKADIFILKRILHDWDDEKALQILRNVSTAMIDENVLYIVDAVVDQCQDKKLILDIDLRLMTIFGGQERTKAELEALCNAAGLEIVAIQHLTSISHVIECRKMRP
jgi:hypothetical protein